MSQTFVVRDGEQIFEDEELFFWIFGDEARVRGAVALVVTYCKAIRKFYDMNVALFKC